MDDDEFLKLALDHSWAWFSKHAGQRMQLMNYLLLSISFILAAYGTTLSTGHRAVAGGIALLGVFIVLTFWLLDSRTIKLQEAAEPALGVIESRLSARIGISVEFVTHTRRHQVRFVRYRVLTRALVLTSACAFLVGAVYAFRIA